LCTIVMHIMLGTCVPNLRGRGWVEHTQIYPALKKDTKNFHYTSNSCGILVISLFHETKIPTADTKVLGCSNFGKKWNLQAPWGMDDFTLPSVGASFKKWKFCTPILPKGMAQSSNFSKKKFKKIQNIQKKGPVWHGRS
jgi:hypothetical protein